MPLYVVPAMYSYLTTKEWTRGEVERRTAAVADEVVPDAIPGPAAEPSG